MKVIIAFLLGALCVGPLGAQCPDPATLKDENEVKLCARLYEDSHYYDEQSCGGKYIDAYPNDDVPILPYRWNDHVSSLVVASRCSLTAWSRSKKEGSKKKFSAGIQHRLKDVGMGLFGTWDNDISGYVCEC